MNEAIKKKLKEILTNLGYNNPDEDPIQLVESQKEQLFEKLNEEFDIEMDHGMAEGNPDAFDSVDALTDFIDTMTEDWEGDEEIEGLGEDDEDDEDATDE